MTFKLITIKLQGRKIKNREKHSEIQGIGKKNWPDHLQVSPPLVAAVIYESQLVLMLAEVQHSVMLNLVGIEVLICFNDKIFITNPNLVTRFKDLNSVVSVAWYDWCEIINPVAVPALASLAYFFFVNYMKIKKHDCEINTIKGWCAVSSFSTSFLFRQPLKTC